MDYPISLFFARPFFVGAALSLAPSRVAPNRDHPHELVHSAPSHEPVAPPDPVGGQLDAYAPHCVSSLASCVYVRIVGRAAISSCFEAFFRCVSARRPPVATTAAVARTARVPAASVCGYGSRDDGKLTLWRSVAHPVPPARHDQGQAPGLGPEPGPIPALGSWPRGL